MLLWGLAEGRGFCKLMAFIELIQTTIAGSSFKNWNLVEVCKKVAIRLTLNLLTCIVTLSLISEVIVGCGFYFMILCEYLKMEIFSPNICVGSEYWSQGKQHCYILQKCYSYPLLPRWHSSVLIYFEIQYESKVSQLKKPSPVSDQLVVLTVFLCGYGWAEAIKDLPQNFPSRYVESNLALDSHC